MSDLMDDGIATASTTATTQSRKRKQPSTSEDVAPTASLELDLSVKDVLLPENAADITPLKKARLQLPPLMNLVSRDADALSVVLLLLSWNDLASLYATSQSWRNHLSFTRRVICSVNNQLELLPHQYRIAQHADWITAHVSKLRVTEETWAQCENRFSEGVYGRRPASSTELELSGLARFRELKHLELSLPSMCFNQDIFNIIGHDLHHLRSISILWEEDHIPLATKLEKARSISFAPLKNLKNLEELAFVPTVNKDYHCTKEQMQQIVELKAIKTLRCGLMIGRHVAEADSNRTREQWLSECASLLQQLPNLEEVSELLAVIHVDGWIQLSKCTSLSRLSFRWPDAMGADWSRLTNLRETLREFAYEPEDYNSVRSEPAMLAALAECTNLERLKFDTVNFPLEEFENLLAQLPSLKKMGFRHCRFEKLSSFAKASPTLQELDMFHCLDMDRERFDWDKELPIMSGLTKLSIVEIRNNRFVMHSSRASKKLAQLLVRKMPKLESVFTYILETVYDGGGVDASDDD